MSGNKRKLVTFVIGSAVLILGITLILLWAEDVASLFRGAVGLVLALASLLVLYSLNKQ